MSLKCVVLLATLSIFVKEGAGFSGNFCDGDKLYEGIIPALTAEFNNKYYMRVCSFLNKWDKEYVREKFNQDWDYANSDCGIVNETSRSYIKCLSFSSWGRNGKEVDPKKPIDIISAFIQLWYYSSPTHVYHRMQTDSKSKQEQDALIGPFRPPYDYPIQGLVRKRTVNEKQKQEFISKETFYVINTGSTAMKNQTAAFTRGFPHDNELIVTGTDDLTGSATVTFGCAYKLKFDKKNVAKATCQTKNNVYVPAQSVKVNPKSKVPVHIKFYKYPTEKNVEFDFDVDSRARQYLNVFRMTIETGRMFINLDVGKNIGMEVKDGRMIMKNFPAKELYSLYNYEVEFGKEEPLDSDSGGGSTVQNFCDDNGKLTQGKLSVMADYGDTYYMRRCSLLKPQEQSLARDQYKQEWSYAHSDCVLKKNLINCTSFTERGRAQKTTTEKPIDIVSAFIRLAYETSPLFLTSKDKDVYNLPYDFPILSVHNQAESELDGIQEELETITVYVTNTGKETLYDGQTVAFTKTFSAVEEVTLKNTEQLSGEVLLDHEYGVSALSGKADVSGRGELKVTLNKSGTARLEQNVTHNVVVPPYSVHSVKPNSRVPVRFICSRFRVTTDYKLDLEVDTDARLPISFFRSSVQAKEVFAKLTDEQGRGLEVLDDDKVVLKGVEAMIVEYTFECYARRGENEPISTGWSAGVGNVAQVLDLEQMSLMNVTDTDGLTHHKETPK